METRKKKRRMMPDDYVALQTAPPRQEFNVDIPTSAVRMNCGGKVKKMSSGGQCRGAGAALRGTKYSRGG